MCLPRLRHFFHDHDGGQCLAIFSQPMLTTFVLFISRSNLIWSQLLKKGESELGHLPDIPFEILDGKNFVQRLRRSQNADLFRREASSVNSDVIKRPAESRIRSTAAANPQWLLCGECLVQFIEQHYRLLLLSIHEQLN